MQNKTIRTLSIKTISKVGIDSILRALPDKSQYAFCEHPAEGDKVLHYHLVARLGKPCKSKTFSDILTTLDPCNYCTSAKSIPSCLRYLIHKDNPEKCQIEKFHVEHNFALLEFDGIMDKQTNVKNKDFRLMITFLADHRTMMPEHKVLSLQALGFRNNDIISTLSAIDECRNFYVEDFFNSPEPVFDVDKMIEETADFCADGSAYADTDGDDLTTFLTAKIHPMILELKKAKMTLDGFSPL